jgi:ABC-2 type transport system permease protein
MLGSYVAELLKFIRRPAVWVVVAVWIVLGFAFNEVFPYIAYRSATGPGAASRLLVPLLPQQLPGNAIVGDPLWGGALILVLGALCAGSEYGWGTLKTMLSLRPSRLTFYLAQVATLATAVAVLVVVGLVLALLASIVIANSAKVSLVGPSVAATVQAIGAGWLILFMWSLLGVCLAVVFRGLALSIGLGLVWILAIENLVRYTAPLIGAVAKADRFMPGADAGSLVAALGGVPASNTGVAAVVNGSQAFIGVLLYAALFAIVGAVTLLRRDVP